MGVQEGGETGVIVYDPGFDGSGSSGVRMWEMSVLGVTACVV